MIKPNLAMLRIVNIQLIKKFPHFFDAWRINALSPSISNIKEIIRHWIKQKKLFKLPLEIREFLAKGAQFGFQALDFLFELFDALVVCRAAA